jgi:DNA polymerase iota
MIEHNSGLLNPNNLQSSFFCLSRQDPAVGFAYDATRFHGHTYPSDGEADRLSASSWPDRDQLYVRLLVASHLAGYLRRQLEHDRGYTATVGVSTCKALSKLAGSAHKPDDQTALLPPYDWAQRTESNVIKFLDSHEIRKIPGIGSKIARILKTHLIESSRLGSSDSGLVDDKITVHDVRHFPGMGPGLLEQILGGPGSSKGIGIRIWNLIYGVDDSEVLEARDFPTQISIEDSYRQLDTLEAVKRELVSLSSNLIRRVRVDLTEKDEDTDSGIRWLAHPRTLRLSTRPKAPPAASGARAHSFNRVSRSAPLPQYVFNLGERVDALGERLVQDLALSMFRKLHPEKSGWSLSLLNVAVTNMVERAGEQKGSNGRDIKQMFQRQETVLKEWKVPEPTPTQLDSGLEVHQGHGVWEESDDDEAIPSVICGRCGASIPHFALVAHEVYHSAGEDEVVDTST